MKIKHLLLLLPLFTLAACSIETDSSGDLGGYWHLESVDTLATGGHADLSGRRLFWAMQGSLLNVTDRDAGSSYLLRVSHQNDSITLSEPYYDNRSAGDPVLTDATELFPFGVHQLTEHFAIESLHSGSMVLSNRELRLGFKKF